MSKSGEEILAEVRAALLGHEFDCECLDAHKVAEVAALVGLTVVRSGNSFLMSVQESRGLRPEGGRERNDDGQAQ